MKKNIEKLLLLTLAVMLVTGCGSKKNVDKKGENEATNSEEEIVVNTNEDVVKDQIFDNLSFTNTSVTKINGVSRIETQIKNETGADYYLEEFVITFLDGDGSVIAVLPGYVGEVIRNGQTYNIDSSTDIDLSNAAKIEYSVTK